ncbi:MAG TPA: polysaccharide deacetylase family protein [Rhizobacter sp.]|nr:polysaccharide deacetylase family protein [Rhizobacter sp.]
MHSSPTFPPLASSLPWRMPVLVKASVACHLGAGAAMLAEPALWPWAVGALAVDHALIAGAGLWPRSTWLGSNMHRLPEASAARREISLTIDDGPDPEVTPAVLDLLDAHGARATFFCIARHAQTHARLCRAIVERGHSVQNHTHRHSHTFAFSGPRAFAREIDAAQDAFAQITGVRPVFFRAPAGFRNMFLAPVLHDRGLQLVSWTRRGYDTARRDPAGVLTRLTRGLAAGDILLLHDGNVQRAASGRAVSLEVLPPLLQRISQAGLRTVTLPQALRAEGAA